MSATAPRPRAYTLADTLQAVVPWELEGVFPAPSRALVEELARRLPAALTDYFYLERWLDGSQRLDLVVRVDADRRALLRQGLASLRPAPAEAAAWQRLAEFVRLWSQPGEPLAAAVEAVWLEFDLPGPQALPASGLPVPRVFVDFPRRIYAGLPLMERLALARAALAALLGRTGLEQVNDSLRRALERLPPEGRLVYVGAATAATTTRARLCVLGLSDAELPCYLDELGWPGSLARLRHDVLEPLARAACHPAGKSVAIAHFDLLPELAPVVGLEYAFDRRRQRPGVLAENALLEALGRHGRCDAELCAGLLGWPDERGLQLPHEIWHSRVTRRLAHAKLVFEQEHVRAVKAYLCCRHELTPGQPVPRPAAHDAG